jgi:copper chaperone CopZ
MTCAACAARVAKKLNAIDGVRATVNFATERAYVTAPASVPVRRLIEAVEQAGYGAELLTRGGTGAGADSPAAEAGGGPDADRVSYLRNRLSAGNAGDDPGQPGLGVRLQHRRHPAGGRRPPQPADRRGGDGRVVGIRGG